MENHQSHIQGHRVTFMHAKLWEAAKAAQAEADNREGRNAEYANMHALIDGAFALEAYLQFLGSLHHPNWNTVERTSFRKRLKAVASVCGIEMNFADQPYSTVIELVKARNGIAHARPQYSSINHVVEGCANMALAMDKSAPFELLCTKSSVKTMLDAVEKVISGFHQASGGALHPLYVQGISSAVIRKGV